MTTSDFELIWKREYSISQGLPAVTGLFDFIEQFLEEDIVVRGEWNLGWLSVYSREGLMLDVGKKIVGQIEQGDEAVDSWTVLLHERGNNLVVFAKNLRSPENRALSNILTDVNESVELYEKYVTPLWHSFYVAEAAGNVLRKRLSSKSTDKDADIMMSALSKPSEKAHVMKITEQFRQVEDIDLRINYLKENFPWIGSIDPFLPPYTRPVLE